ARSWRRYRDPGRDPGDLLQGRHGAVSRAGARGHRAGGGAAGQSGEAGRDRRQAQARLVGAAGFSAAARFGMNEDGAIPRTWRDPALLLKALPTILLQVGGFLAPLVLTLILTFQTTKSFQLQWTWDLATW